MANSFANKLVSARVPNASWFDSTIAIGGRFGVAYGLDHGRQLHIGSGLQYCVRGA